MPVLITDASQLEPLPEILGEGGGGKVQVCRVISTRQLVALKIIPKSKLKSVSAIERAYNECILAETLESELVPKCLGSFSNEEFLFIVLELVEFGDLASHLRLFGPMSIERIKFYAAECVLFLEFLHSSKVIHRDFKLRNIVISKSGHLKIVDFGQSARLNAFSDRAYTLLGTPQYTAPEVILRQPYGFAVDWWALGICIYELACARLPFFDPNVFTTYELILYSDLKFPIDRPIADKWFIDMIQRLLEKNPEKRLGWRGSQEIKTHPWFAEIDWDKLLSSTAPKFNKSLVCLYAEADQDYDLDSESHRLFEGF